MAKFLNLQLDQNNDLILDPQAALTDSEAVAQAVRTKLLLFQGEWWENYKLGLPMFQRILGQLDTKSNQNTSILLMQQVIRTTPYVINIPQSGVVDDGEGNQGFSFSVQTTFGTVRISNIPALDSILGTSV